MALPPSIADVDADHIRSLVSERAAEGQHLELKRDLPRLADGSSRHELFADVSAFANGSGGDLVYGVEEDGEGRASGIWPIAGNPDEEALRIQNSLTSGIEPRVPGLQVRAVPVDGGFVVVVRVPQSWAGPHRVKTNQHFFVRAGGAKRQLDMPEIRGMFLRSDAQAERVRDFRSERVGRVLTGDLPAKLIPGPTVVVHLVPTQAALGLVAIEPGQYLQERRLPALGTNVASTRLNMDGALGTTYDGPQGSRSYSLFFRNGFFEAVGALARANASEAYLGCNVYEQELVTLVKRFRSELRHLGIGEELTVMWTLVRAHEVMMHLGRREFDLKDHDYQGKFDRQVLAVPDVLIPADQDGGRALRPLFDLVWQSAGFAYSYNYNEAGDWAPSA